MNYTIWGDEESYGAMAKKDALKFSASVQTTLGCKLHRVKQEQVRDSKGIVIVEVFVAAGDGKHALRQQMLELVFDEPLVSLVPEAAREPREEVDMVGDLPQQQQPSVRGDVATVERCDDIAATETLKSERGSITLCPHWPVPLSGSLLCLNQ